MKHLFLLLAFVLTTSTAFAHWGNWPEQKSRANSLNDKTGLFLDDTSTYQIGPEWGKKVVTENSLKNENEVFQKAAKRTAYFGRATAFYLGKFNGYHVMGTNYHVISNAWECSSLKMATFKLLGNKKFPCEKFFGAWSDVDFALFAIKVTDAADEALLATVAQNMGFHSKIYQGQKLLTIGHGVGKNPNQDIVSNQDDDCMVYSNDNDIRFMADPDDLNPGDYKVWSFANGCDVSHGDSGSAVVDRVTGDIVGIIWTGRIPKDPKVLDSNYLSDIFNTDSEEVWKQLSYSAPSFKIYEVLKTYVDSGTAPVDTQETLVQLLN